MAIFQTWQLLGGATLALIIYSIWLVVYRLYFHPLAKFPGPKAAPATEWYEIWFDVVKRGQFMWEIKKMHEKYGPVVRINPDELHIKDPEFYDEIYASGAKKRDKYDKWTMMAGAPRSAFSTPEHEIHRTRRGALSPFFAKRSVVGLEPRIQERVTTLCNRLAGFIESGDVVRLDVAMMALTMDVITEYCYGFSDNYISEPDFKASWKEAMADLFEGAAFRRTVPWLTLSLQKIPDEYLLSLMPALGILINWQEEIKKTVKKVLDTPEDKKQTIFHSLRDSDLAPSEKDLHRLSDEGEILMAAGSETTAKTLAITAFYIINNPPVLKRMREELTKVMPSSTSSAKWIALEQLPYFSAVVSEGIRLSYGITTRSPRRAHEELNYKGWTIPARTPISEITYFISMDPKIFPDPEKFNPDRWLGQERLDRYQTSFSKGTRGCVGINLAYAELYLTLAGIFRRFDFELFETTIEDVKIQRDAFVPAAKLDSKGVRVIVKGEA